MSQTVVIDGVTFSDINGFKVSDTNNNTLTYVHPEGTLSITQNGTGIDVSQYAAVDVAVPGSGGVSITQNANGYLVVGAASASGYVANDWLDPTKPTGAVVSDVILTANDASTFKSHTGVTSIHLTATTLVPGGFCERASNLETFVGRALTGTVNSMFMYCTNLVAVDILGGSTLNIDMLRFDTKCNVLVLRSSTLTPLSNYNTFRGSCYASGAAGGTIYIPKSLYDHLGDGGEYDYKSATSWSTVDGYGTITWAQIEGSYYETHYADGTTIPTT